MPLWTGQPGSLRPIAVLGPLMAALVVVRFVVERVNVSLFTAGFVVLAVAAAVFAIVARARTHYTVTSKRIFIAQGREVTTVDLDMLGPVVLEAHAGGRGTLFFELDRFGLLRGASLPAGEEEQPREQFHDIADAAMVKDTIERARAAARRRQ